MIKPVIFQVVGYSNSGKTTLVTKYINRLTDTGWKVATIKHHGHNKPLTQNDEGKDSSLHRKAGALGTLVASDHEIQWNVKLEAPFQLDELLVFYVPLSLDVILVEGYKMEHYPKIVLHRGEEDDELLANVTNIEAVICWHVQDKVKWMQQIEQQVFHIKEEEDYIAWIVDWIKAQKGE